MDLARSSGLQTCLLVNSSTKKHTIMKVSEAKIIDIPKIEDRRGNLSVVEEYNQIPFKISRAYWVYDVPGG